jgi:hypothetical protein
MLRINAAKLTSPTKREERRKRTTRRKGIQEGYQGIALHCPGESVENESKTMRLAAYGALSTSLATAVILAAFQQRPNFYSACVYLSQSNACLMILTNMGVFLTILFGFTVQKLFFGHLRAIEEAHLRERTWFAVTETFLAMTVFRDEFNTRFVVMFVSLLFVKCFHWICQDRIDYVCQFGGAFD